jgi:hypothetical protein
MVGNAFDPVSAWVGSGNQRIRDLTFSTRHGGALSNLGSGIFGFVQREHGDDLIPALSRGALNLFAPATALANSAVSAGVLTLSAASVERINFTSAQAVTRFAAPNWPDKTGVIYFTNGNVTITPGVNVLGLPEALVLPAGVKAAIEYQALDTSDAPILIKSVRIEIKDEYTVATLPSATIRPHPRTLVTDANATTFASVVAGGGANKVPVYSDGTDWRIG